MKSYNQETKEKKKKNLSTKKKNTEPVTKFTQKLYTVEKRKGTDKQFIREKKAEQQKPKTVYMVVTFAILISPFKIIIMNLVIIWSVHCYSNKFVNAVSKNILNYEGGYLLYMLELDCVGLRCT